MCAFLFSQGLNPVKFGNKLPEKQAVQEFWAAAALSAPLAPTPMQPEALIVNHYTAKG